MLTNIIRDCYIIIKKNKVKIEQYLINQYLKNILIDLFL
jgi:hypothetical protein